MYKKEYQGGAHVDVFSAQGRDPASQCRLVGSVKRLYDKRLHGYVFLLEGGASSTSSRLHIPKDDRSTLGLVQRCLVLQLNLPLAGRIAIEVTLTDSSGSRQRINLSTSVKEVSSSPLHARVPLSNLTNEKWLNVCIDLESLVRGLFRGQHFKSLERVSLGGSFSLRRIVTLKTPPTSEEFPKSCEMPQGIEIPQTVIVSYESITDSEVRGEVKGQEVEEEEEEGPSTASFRTRSLIPEQTSISRKSLRPALSAGRQLTSGEIRAPPSTGGQPLSPPSTGGQPLSTATDTGRVYELSLEADGRGLRPLPPSEPVERSLLKIQKKRVQLHVQSRGKEKVSQPEATKESFISEVAATSELGGVAESLGTKVTRPSEEELEVVDILKTAESAKEEQSNVSEQMETSGMWPDDVTMETTYFYLSHPKSASDVKQSIAMETTSRGGLLDDDFVSNDNHQGSPHNASDDHNISRLSDDYDWRQYASKDDGEHEDLSLRTRLAKVRPAHQNASVDIMDNSLSGSASMTLSGWTERFREATAHGAALQDSLEIRDMGGTLTPALGNTLTEQPDFPVDLPGNVQGNSDQELDLMYDPQLNCFYDPVTNKYYELVQ